MVSAHATCSDVFPRHCVCVLRFCQLPPPLWCHILLTNLVQSPFPSHIFISCTENVIEGGWSAGCVRLWCWKNFHPTFLQLCNWSLNCGKYPASSLLQGPPCGGSSAFHLPEEGGGRLEFPNQRNCDGFKKKLFFFLQLYFGTRELSLAELRFLVFFFANTVHSHNAHSYSKHFLGYLLISLSLIYLCREIGRSMSHCLQEPEWVICAIYSVLLVVPYLVGVNAKLNFKISEIACIYTAVL